MGRFSNCCGAFVTPDFFETLGAGLISGRMLEDTDTTQTPLVVLVDEAGARRFWGDGNPIGQHIRQTRDIFVKGKRATRPMADGRGGKRAM